MIADDNTLYLAKAELAAVAAFMSRDDDRPNLQAMFVDHDRRRVWASDGHRAVMVTAPEGDHLAPGQPLAIPAASVLATLRAARARDTIAISVKKRRLAVTVFEGEAGPGAEPASKLSTLVRPSKIDPMSIEAVIPRYETKAARVSRWIALNPRYLAAFGELWRVSRDDDRPVVLYRSGELDPILGVLTADDGTRWRVIVMPVRYDVAAAAIAAGRSA